MQNEKLSVGFVYMQSQFGFLSGSGILFQNAFGASLIDFFHRQFHRRIFVRCVGFDRSFRFFQNGFQVGFESFIFLSFCLIDQNSFFRDLMFANIDTSLTTQYIISLSF